MKQMILTLCTVIIIFGCDEEKVVVPDVGRERAHHQRIIDSLRILLDKEPMNTGLAVSFGRACSSMSSFEYLLSSRGGWSSVTRPDLVGEPLDIAINYLERTAQSDSTSPQLYVTLGWLYFARLNLNSEVQGWMTDHRAVKQKARNHFERASSLDSSNVNAQFGRLLLLLPGRWWPVGWEGADEVLALARKTVGMAPMNGASHYWLARVLDGTQRSRGLSRWQKDQATDEVISSYRKAIELGIDKASMNLWMAGYIRNVYGLSSSYFRMFGRRFETTPGFIKGFLLIGFALFEMDGNEKSFELVSRALDQQPLYPAALMFRSALHRERGMQDEAIADYLMATRLNPYVLSYIYFDTESFVREVLVREPNSLAANITLGESNLQRPGNTAIDYIRKALEIDPASAYAWNLLAQAFEERELVHQADSSYRKMIEFVSDNSVNFYNARRFFVSQGMFDMALAVTEKELSGGWKDTATGYWDLGRSYAEHGDSVLALRYYRKAYPQIGPANLPYAARELARLYIAEGRFREALEVLEDALARGAGDAWSRAWSHIQMGEIYAQMGVPEKAIGAYEKGISLQDVGSWRYDLGQELLKVRRREEALEQFRKAAGLGWQPAVDTLKYFENRGEK